MANVEKPTKGAKKFRQKARPKEYVKNFKIFTFSGESYLLEMQDNCPLLRFVDFLKIWV